MTHILNVTIHFITTECDDHIGSNIKDADIEILQNCEYKLIFTV